TTESRIHAADAAAGTLYFFFFKQKTAYEIGLGIPAEPLFRSINTILYVPHRHVYGEQWIKFMKDGVNATPLPTVNTTGYIDHAAFLGTINPDTNKIPKHLFQRSEERRVGKECRCRWVTNHEKKKEIRMT